MTYCILIVLYVGIWIIPASSEIKSEWGVGGWEPDCTAKGTDVTASGTN